MEIKNPYQPPRVNSPSAWAAAKLSIAVPVVLLAIAMLAVCTLSRIYLALPLVVGFSLAWITGFRLVTACTAALIAFLFGLVAIEFALTCLPELKPAEALRVSWLHERILVAAFLAGAALGTGLILIIRCLINAVLRLHFDPQSPFLAKLLRV